MHKHLKGRAVLLAGVSVVVLGGAIPSSANPVIWGSSKKQDIIVPEPVSKKKPEKFTPTVTRTVVTRTITTGTTTTTSVIETPPVPATPGAAENPRRETVGLSSKPFDEIIRANRAPKSAKRATTKGVEKTDKLPRAIPAGPLHVIVSVDQQRASLYANGQFVASTKVSTGTKSHPTPMGVFSVIQKNRHHVSNLYDAPMPYMQRLTWSGTAMHTGALPGYPASHGCIRLTDNFAQMLWKATKIGARVIITRDDVKPVEFTHAKLLTPKPHVAALPPAPAKPAETTGAPVRTADATGTVTGAVAQDAERPAEVPAPAVVTATPASEPKLDPRLMITEAMPSSKEIERRNTPVSIFVSRKDGKLYVRQAMQPLFDLPVTLRDPGQPIGTHVYTAMELKGGAMRWTAVTIPSTFSREPEKKSTRGRNSEVPAPAVLLPPSNATAALERFDMPQEAAERLAAMLVPGSSLIVSDNGIAGETGTYTDFIILTR
jgi:lipoprotein-anchoring transpeptidase ErfK/SrfK